MPSVTADLSDIPGSSDDREFLYAVLNLPNTASEYEIRERYRQLSVLFHPDKQHDERTKETAAKRFLEVQKAYQVLSDPVSRRAYDILGPEGLKIISATDFNSLSPTEFDNALVQQNKKLERKRVEDVVRATGRISAAFDASSLFEDLDDRDYERHTTWNKRLVDRLQAVQQSSLSVRHSIQKEIDKQTVVVLSGRMASRGTANVEDIATSARGALMGTIRHQYSPRLNFEATTNLLRSSNLGVKTTYHDDDSTVLLQLFFSRTLTTSFWESLVMGRKPIPPATIAYSRRLFRNSPTEGTVLFSTNATIPILSFTLSSAHLFDHTPEASIPVNLAQGNPIQRPPSPSGLSIGTSFWNVAFTMAGPLSTVGGEWGVNFAEVDVQVKTVLQWSLDGANWLFSGEWRREDSSMGASVGVGMQGVVLKFDMSYLGQQLSLPITLSHDCDTRLAFWTTVVPSTALVTAYWFILRPRRLRQRIEFFRKARRVLKEEKSDLLRETKETISLLQETAKRHMQAETSCGGLVVLEAVYGPSERDEATGGLDVDVTVPLQALVNKSQLYIPGRRSKVGNLFPSVCVLLGAGRFPFTVTSVNSWRV
ncbi:hypothetical protein AcV5_000221 [Taiwanofungus camphoratus]|nr:hypothetical protein AcV5_000221 [Antrodia cinnamomea]